MEDSGQIKLSLKDRKLLDQAIKIIIDQLENEAFGVEDLRQALGLSRSQLHRRLMKISGLSTTHFIRAIRLKKALELLLEGDLPVSEVAYRTGFSNPSYFSQCFRNQYGFPPGDIHKQKASEIDQRTIFYPEIYVNDAKEASRPDLKKHYIYTFLIAAIILLGAIILIILRTNEQSQRDDLSIAVLPFKNFSDNQDNQYLSDGMMEAVITNISQIGGLKVISRTSVEQYRETSKSIKQIGSELGVSYILEGSTFQDTHNIRVTIQLINTKTDEHVWSESYDSALKDIFSVQRQIARRIANILEVKITDDEWLRIERQPTLSPKAYDLYQQAFFYFVRYFQQRHESDYKKSRILFSEALKEDSTFAAAYARLADLYWNRNYRIEYYHDTFMDSVYMLSTTALTYDPNSSDAHRLLGQYYFETGRRAMAIAELETSISLNRNNSTAYEVLGFYYNWIGNWEKGIPLLYESIRLDPFSIFVSFRYNFLARGYLDLLDFDNTFLYCERAIDFAGGIKPAISFGYWIKAHTNLMLGNSREALAAAEKVSAYNEISALRIEAEVHSNLLKDFQKSVYLFEELAEKEPGHFNYKHRYAYALWQTGKYDSASVLFDMQIKEFEEELALGRVERNDPHYNLAAIYAFLNKSDSALAHLHKHKFTSGLEIYATRDPLFRNLYEHPKFKEIIEQAKSDKARLREKIKHIIQGK